MYDLFFKNSLWDTPRMHFEKSKGNMSCKQIHTLLSDFNFSLITFMRAAAPPINKKSYPSWSPTVMGCGRGLASEDAVAPPCSVHLPFPGPCMLMSWPCHQCFPPRTSQEQHLPRPPPSLLGIARWLGLVMFGVLIHFTKIAFHSLADR